MSTGPLVLACVITALVAGLAAALLYGVSEGRHTLGYDALRRLGGLFVAVTIVAVIAAVAVGLAGLWRWAL